MNNYKIISISHKHTDLDKIGMFHLEEERVTPTLDRVKTEMDLEELLYLSTCNRVEFVFSTEKSLDKEFVNLFFKAFGGSDEVCEIALCSAKTFEEKEAVNHLFRVTSSLESLVIGEREIITQVKNSFQRANESGLTGDRLRILLKKTIETAKKVYTDTGIACKPVSIVSLAYRKIKDLNLNKEGKVLVIGSGKTNTAMARFLKKHGFGRFSVFNRTLENAKTLAGELEGDAYLLNDLHTYNQGFDVIITCTGASEPIITADLYKKLIGKDESKKLIVDLAIPNDVDQEVVDNFNVKFVSVEELKRIAQRNLEEREKELSNCEKIIKESLMDFEELFQARRVELAMSEIPRQIKEIKSNAMDVVFGKEIERLDDEAKLVLEKALSYMEKKCIGIPMKMAREIITGYQSGVK